ncbi:SNF2/RAD54 family helicase [Mycobacterium tuberculosis]|nr:SNF2/RAD54 family helicase [Mycobacterium tuberculosis]CRD64385.1 SNF2/RAD54 family helicase [Mycobacterium tuberculosis]SGL24483.1 SNF2/RAD54 family helicase [Mycobacterium tuberculosis]SGP08294.1 SNF2/RAD54 family helicase [Mycobacterium tuberculosis]
MLVLHGFWSNSGGMRLWAEDSDLLVKSPSQALRSARPHPFAAPADLIAGIHPGKPATAVLLLPSLRSAPLDSPELIRLAPRPAARTDPMLLAWTVPVVDLDPTAALAAFDQPAPDVRYGASVDYLAELAVFARELVERGRDDLAGLGDAAGLPRRSWWARPARTGNLGSGRDGRRRRARGAVTDGPAAPATGSLQTASGRGGLADRVDLPGRPVRRGARRTRRAGRGVAAMGRRRYRHRRPGAGDVSAVRSRDRKRGDARGLVVEAGVLIAVDAGPQPAGPRRAGMERRRQPAPLAGPAAGAAADRTGPGLSDFPRARPGAAHRVPVRA